MEHVSPYHTLSKRLHQPSWNTDRFLWFNSPQTQLFSPFSLRPWHSDGDVTNFLFTATNHTLHYCHTYQSVAIFILGSPTEGFSTHTPVMQESKLPSRPNKNGSEIIFLFRLQSYQSSTFTLLRLKVLTPPIRHFCAHTSHYGQILLQYSPKNAYGLILKARVSISLSSI